MGPSIFIDGEGNAVKSIGVVKGASMGPSIFIDGECSPMSVTDALPRRFNGAVDLHRWRVI